MPTHLQSHRPEDARNALRAAADGESRLRGAITYGGVAPFLVLWGAIWAVGFGATRVGVRPAWAVWGSVVSLGWAGTALLTQMRAANREAGDSSALRYALSAAVLSAHAVVWASILLSHQPNAIGVYAGTVTGCAYAVAGLWRGMLLLVLGVAVTALFLAGLAMSPPSFAVYAGVLGGGGLVAAGLVFRRLDPT